jgi:hypothetical protein
MYMFTTMVCGYEDRLPGLCAVLITGSVAMRYKRFIPLRVLLLTVLYV